MDDARTPSEPAAALQEGDRVKFEGEVRRLGEENALVRFWSGSMFQYVWVAFRHVLKADSTR